MEEEFFNHIEEMRNLPKGGLLDNPSFVISTGIVIMDTHLNVLMATKRVVSFTRRSLKHLLEKDAEGERLIALIKDIIENAQEVRKGVREGRFIFIKMIKKPTSKPYPHAVVVETGETCNVIITAFVTNEKYLQDFEILWRTETL
jgi:hypothetical protein